mmetsp:Transcript_57062/g.149899  ORF Transcript_57062/g.149899 Transcript_57062/m.149899 type:complete len:224 (-) Transcript_57062:446-1117(-)
MRRRRVRAARRLLRTTPRAPANTPPKQGRPQSELGTATAATTYLSSFLAPSPSPRRHLEKIPFLPSLTSVAAYEMRCMLPPPPPPPPPPSLIVPSACVGSASSGSCCWPRQRAKSPRRRTGWLATEPMERCNERYFLMLFSTCRAYLAMTSRDASEILEMATSIGVTSATSSACSMPDSDERLYAAGSAKCSIVSLSRARSNARTTNCGRAGYSAIICGARPT